MFEILRKDTAFFSHMQKIYNVLLYFCFMITPIPDCALQVVTLVDIFIFYLLLHIKPIELFFSIYPASSSTI